MHRLCERHISFYLIHRWWPPAATCIMIDWDLASVHSTQLPMHTHFLAMDTFSICLNSKILLNFKSGSLDGKNSDSITTVEKQKYEAKNLSFAVAPNAMLAAYLLSDKCLLLLYGLHWAHNAAVGCFYASRCYKWIFHRRQSKTLRLRKINRNVEQANADHTSQ